VSEPTTIGARIERAHQEVYRVCQPLQHWRMSVPADPERDSDLIIEDGLIAGEEALAALAEREALDVELLAREVRDAVLDLIPDYPDALIRVEEAAIAAEQAVLVYAALAETPEAARLPEQPVGLMGPHRVLKCSVCGSELLARRGSITHNDDGSHGYDPGEP